MKTSTIQRILTTIHHSGLDKIYQQVGGELGVIFTLHDIRDDRRRTFSPNRHLSVEPEFLEAFILMLKHRNIDLVSMDEARRRILNPNPLTRFAAITFDDCYRNNMTKAAPILHKHEVPYTIYCCTGFTERTAELWWYDIEFLVRQQDRIMLQKGQGPIELDCTSPKKKMNCYNYLMDYFMEEVPEVEQRQRVRELCWLYKIDQADHLNQNIMDWSELRELAKHPLCTIGAHTLTHPSLARLKESQAREEIFESASVIEAELGERPKHFAYPYGFRKAAASREFDLAKQAKYDTAVTTRSGHIFPQHRNHLTALPRISLNGLFQEIRYISPLATGFPTRLMGGMRRLNVS